MTQSPGMPGPLDADMEFLQLAELTESTNTEHLEQVLEYFDDI